MSSRIGDSKVATQNMTCSGSWGFQLAKSMLLAANGFLFWHFSRFFQGASAAQGNLDHKAVTVYGEGNGTALAQVVASTSQLRLPINMQKRSALQTSVSVSPKQLVPPNPAGGPCAGIDMCLQGGEGMFVAP